MSERSAHGRVHAVAAHAEAVLVGRAEYEIWLRILTGELTTNQAATRAGGGSLHDHDVAEGGPGRRHRGVAGVASGDVRTRFKGAEEAVERSGRFPAGAQGTPASRGWLRPEETPWHVPR
jgi:hypothetical protein